MFEDRTSNIIIEHHLRSSIIFDDVRSSVSPLPALRRAPCSPRANWGLGPARIAALWHCRACQCAQEACTVSLMRMSLLRPVLRARCSQTCGGPGMSMGAGPHRLDTGREGYDLLHIFESEAHVSAASMHCGRTDASCSTVGAVIPYRLNLTSIMARSS
jgi:hypothetical protein